MKERLLPKPSVAITTEQINRTLHRLSERWDGKTTRVMGVPITFPDYLGNEDAAWDLAEELIDKGWRINLWGQKGAWVAECVGDLDLSGVPLAWLPQARSTRTEALCHAMLDSLSRLRIGGVQDQGTVAPCPLCNGQGVSPLRESQMQLLKQLRCWPSGISPTEWHKRDPRITVTGYTNALKRLHQRGVVTRERQGRSWIYKAV